AGLITLEFGRLFLITLPGTILGAWLGRLLYNRLNDRRFDNAVLILLLISGCLLLLSLFR
ncbi:MAG: sulfite exporter TauE/SafE family protein, partial [Proteobacteria bacterium]|nr:sulfite exporter TauE/SafE family protein [Pseudomonadota bacterium]